MKKQTYQLRYAKFVTSLFLGEKNGNLIGKKLSIALRDALLVINYCVLLFLGSLSDFKIFDIPVIFKL